MSAAIEIARALGNVTKEGRGWRCRCPLHGGVSLNLADGDTRLIVTCWAGCKAVDVLAELRRQGLLDDHRERQSSAPISPARDDGKKSLRAQRLWTEAGDPIGTSTEEYWRQTRGLSIPIPPTIRHHGSARHESGASLSAMIAGVTVWPSKQVMAVHRTFLDGAQKTALKPDKAMLGPVSGGTVRLAGAAEEMAIGEGIESCASFQQETGISTWAALSTSGLRAIVLPPLPLAATVHIVADADEAGEKAAQAAAARLHADGRAVKIIRPVGVKDFNDLIRGAMPCLT